MILLMNKHRCETVGDSIQNKTVVWRMQEQKIALRCKGLKVCIKKRTEAAEARICVYVGGAVSHDGVKWNT